MPDPQSSAEHSQPALPESGQQPVGHSPPTHILTTEEALRIVQERLQGSTSRGTVIMPRPKSWSNGLDSAKLSGRDSTRLPSQLPETAQQSHGSVIGPDDPELLASQQTVISQQPWAEPPLLGNLTSREMGKLLNGQTLGHYQLQEFVGGGGMGAVFRAHDTMLNRTVAVKVLAPNQSRDEDTLRRFQNEAQSAARLDHENIGRVHYVGVDRGWNYIVFEFIDGVNLRDLVDEQGPLSIPDTISYLQQLTDALAHASGRDVVHRDIKPSNVIITPEFRAKLVDMGLARLHQVEQQSQDDLTASGVTLGTFDYISPEQARDPRSADVRSDLYSLGCTLYFMLTGKPPFPTGTVLQKLLQHQADEPVDPLLTRSELPRELLAILKKMMAKQPASRYQTPQALLQDLAALATKLHLPALANPGRKKLLKSSVAQPPWYRYLPWAIPVLVASLLLGLGQFWDYLSGPKETELERPTWSEPVKLPVDTVVASNTGNPTPPVAPANSIVAMKSGTKPIAAPAAQAATARPVDNRWPLGMQWGWNYSQQYAYQYWQNLNQQFLPKLTQALPTWTAELTQGLEQFSGQLPMLNVQNSEPMLRAAEQRLAKESRLVVTRHPQKLGEYPSLAAALREAQPGSVIELHWNGVMLERPLIINQQDLTIQAGRDFHPCLRFQTRDSAALGANRGVLTISGGKLRLQGLHIEFDLAEQSSSDAIILCELQQVNELLCTQTVWTVQPSANATLATPATLFVVRSGVTSAIMRMREPLLKARPTLLSLQQSIVRGSASLLRATEHEPVHLKLQNTIIGLADSALIVDLGASETSRQVEPLVNCELRDCSLMLGGSFLRILNQERLPQRNQMNLKLDNVAIRGGEFQPLIDVDDIERTEELTKTLHWEGQATRLDQYTTLIRMVNNTGTTSLGLSQWPEAWQTATSQIISPGATWEWPLAKLPAWSQLEIQHFNWQAVANSELDNSINSNPREGHDASLLPKQLLPSDTGK